MDKKTCKRLLQIAFKTRQNATESAMEYKKVHRTFFIEKIFFSLFIGVCGLFLSATKNATKFFLLSHYRILHLHSKLIKDEAQRKM